MESQIQCSGTAQTVRSGCRNEPGLLPVMDHPYSATTTTTTPIPIATYPASPTLTWGPITAVRWCRYNWGLYIDYHLSTASPLHSIPTPTAWPPPQGLYHWRISPPPFAALGNPTVKSFFAYDLAIAVKMTSSLPRPSPPSTTTP